MPNSALIHADGFSQNPFSDGLDATIDCQDQVLSDGRWQDLLPASRKLAIDRLDFRIRGEPWRLDIDQIVVVVLLNAVERLRHGVDEAKYVRCERALWVVAAWERLSDDTGCVVPFRDRLADRLRCGSGQRDDLHLMCQQPLLQILGRHLQARPQGLDQSRRKGCLVAVRHQPRLYPDLPMEAVKSKRSAVDVDNRASLWSACRNIPASAAGRNARLWQKLATLNHLPPYQLDDQ